MEYEKVKEWLDKLIKNLKEAQENEHFNNQIIAIGPGEKIQIFRGIEIIADVMGVELKETRICSIYPFEYSFVYGGVEFHQLSGERLGKYAGAD